MEFTKDILKATSFVLLLCYLSSVLAGQIVLSRDIVPNLDRTYVEVKMRDKRIQNYTIPGDKESIIIDVPFSSCTLYRSYNVYKDGKVSSASLINEFRVQNNKVVPCAVK